MNSLTYVACANVQTAPDDGVNGDRADGGPLTQVCSRQQRVFSHVVSGQHLHLVQGLHCQFPLTQ